MVGEISLNGFPGACFLTGGPVFSGVLYANDGEVIGGVCAYFAVPEYPPAP